MPYGTVNADTLVTSTSGGILGAGNASIMKNRIINGAMVIDQRNAGASVTPTTGGTYNLDRWQTSLTQSSKFSVQQSSVAPAGFTNSLLITSLSAYSVLSSDFFSLNQAIEGFNVADLGFGTSDAKTITVSFWVRSSLTGSFGAVIGNGDNNRSYPFSYTISSANTWTQISVTIPGDTSGTWYKTNGIGMYLRINLGSGSTYSGTAGAWVGGGLITSVTGSVNLIATNAATFYITGVQLEVGSSATGFEYRMYGTELANCQRYYQKYGPTNTGSVALVTMANWSSSGAYGGFVYPVQLRTTPSFSYNSLSDFTYFTSSSTYSPLATITLNNTSISSGEISITTSTGFTQGYSGWLRINNNTTGYMAFSAEL